MFNGFFMSLAIVGYRGLSIALACGNYATNDFRHYSIPNFSRNLFIMLNFILLCSSYVLATITIAIEVKTDQL